MDLLEYKCVKPRSSHVLQIWLPKCSVIPLVFHNFQIEANLKSAAFEQEARTNASAFDLSGFTNNTVRQLENLLYIGDSALEDQQDLEDVSGQIM